MGRWGGGGGGGVMGCCNDAQILNECQLKESLVDGPIGFPDTDLLLGDDRDMSYFIVADDGFEDLNYEAFLLQKL